MFSFLSNAPFLGIDLGTRNVLCFSPSRGLILNEPSVVAIDDRQKDVLAVGKDAQAMLGRTPGHIVADRPLKGGVIADYDMAQSMIKAFLKKCRSGAFSKKPRVLVAVPWGITAVEQRAVSEAVLASGAQSCFLLHEPLAAAIGSQLPFKAARGSLLVDIGGGTTEIAVISLGGLVVCKSLRVAGDDFDEAIIQHCRRSYNLLIGERMAERIKCEIGSAYPMKDEKSMSVSGRDLMTGLPKTFTISSYEIRDALSESLASILAAIRLTLEQTPPELSGDIMESALYLSGGGSLLLGLKDYLMDELQVDVDLVEHPLEAVARGTGVVLNEALYHGELSSVMAT